MTGTVQKSHLFQPGNPGGGRPKGARSRLQEFTLQLIDEDFRLHGKEVLERVRQKWPQVYLTAVVGLLPRQQQTETVSQLGHLTDAEIETLERMLAEQKAKMIEQIEPALVPADEPSEP